MMATRVARWLAPLPLLLVASGCASSDAGAPTTPAPEQAAASASPTENVELTGSLTLAPASGAAGTSVEVAGEGLPANTSLDLLWGTADCAWQLEGDQNEDYMGRHCEDRDESLATVTTDADGALSASFTVPDGFGFEHDVRLRDGDGVIRNRALFDVEPTVTVTPEAGPVGTPITIEIHGIGYRSLEDTRTILYDNRYVGFMSAVTTGGIARATIPATGAPGPHHIDINRGAYTFPYLNPAQSPRPDIPVFDATFTVTPGDAVLPPPTSEQSRPPVTREVGLDGSTPAIDTDLVLGGVGTPFDVAGAGFDPGATVTLAWFRIVGNRVSGQGWDEQSVSLGDVAVGADGSFTFATEIPGDVGGAHRIAAIQDGDSVAETTVIITPHADPLETTSVPWGTKVTLHLTGVGWTETANIYTVVYDNAYIGYACGFNTQGDVEIPLTITGDPGWHFIDLYPAIYKGDEPPGRNNFRIPQLTYADDHPGEQLPAFHYAIFLEG